VARAIVLGVAAFISLLFLSCGSGARLFAYLALGDSLAAGEGASDPLTKGYVPLVRAQLGDDAKLVNLGAGGGVTSSDLLEAGGQLDQALDEIGGRASDDDDGNDVEVITISIGGNDVRQLTEEGSPCIVDLLSVACVQEAFPDLLSQYRDNLGQILQALRRAAPDAEIVVVTLYNPFAGSGSLLETVVDFALSQFTELVKQVAEDPEVGAKVADLGAPFEERAGEVISADGIHPNDDGHAVIAEAVIAALEES
jgi:lysophospholipase L1-like esterase